MPTILDRMSLDESSSEIALIHIKCAIAPLGEQQLSWDAGVLALDPTPNLSLY